jgi:SP family sugar:H+ symporter-like MFS transporter
VLFSYPAEIQTFSMRSKGMLVWNAITQIEYIYVVFVDAIALDAIGELIVAWEYGCPELTLIGYKYYAVYIPLVVIQWFLIKFCKLGYEATQRSS